MQRRTFLAATAGAAFAQQSLGFPVIDTHIHLFDTGRPQGIPWPPKDNKVLYKTALPDRFRKVASPFGVTGAIETECSPWLEDNQWVLDVAAKDTIMVGLVGNLEPGKPDFRKHLDRFSKNKLFVGIRYGNLWDRNFHEEVKRPEFIAGVKALADANLTLDSANPNPKLVADLLRLSDKVPTLRIVIDHLPQMDPPTEPAALRAYEATLREIHQRPQIFVKVSEVLRRVNGKVPLDVAFYRPRLDQIFETFGEHRVLYGSDWPNSDLWAEYPQVFGVVRDYFMAKGRAVAEQYFWKNSTKAYRWVRRAEDQPRYGG